MFIKISEKVDEIMQINHQVTNYLLDYEKAEIEGAQIPSEKIRENKIFQTLFTRMQKKYRELELMILSHAEDVIENENAIHPIPQSEKRSEILEIIDQETTNLSQYIQNSHIKMKYVDILKVHENGKTTKEKSIYKGNNKEIHDYEVMAQITNLVNLKERIAMDSKPNIISYEEKSAILDDIALKEYTEEHELKSINECIKEIKKVKIQISSQSPVQTETEKQLYILSETEKELYDLKYRNYYAYYNNKYNGILQENDTGKLAIIKRNQEEGNLPFVLDMPKKEIEKIICKGINQRCAKLSNEINQISIKERRAPAQKRKNKNKGKQEEYTR